MPPAPIPQRIAPLDWRKPAFVWTPIALALCIGWPAPIWGAASDVGRSVMLCGVLVFALALSTLGGAWVFGRAPRSRREAVLHVIGAGVLTALAAPFLFGGDQSVSAKLALIPLALLILLPGTLIAGSIFALIALARVPSHPAKGAS